METVEFKWHFSTSLTGYTLGQNAYAVLRPLPCTIAPDDSTHRPPATIGLHVAVDVERVTNSSRIDAIDTADILPTCLDVSAVVRLAR